MSNRIPGWVGAVAAALALGHSAAAGAQALPTLDFVIVDNLGHLPMMVGVEKGLFKQHGVDVRLKIVKSGTEIVNALKKNEVQGGNMSVTTFIKGRQGGEPVTVFALAMNDATRANADDPLAIIARKDSGIKAGDLKTLKGKKVGVWFEQTPDEYLISRSTRPASRKARSSSSTSPAIRRSSPASPKPRSTRSCRSSRGTR